jgi:hypothetical protein
MRRVIFVLLAALLVALTATGCGGSSSTAPTAPTPVKRTVIAGSYNATAHFSRFITFTTTTAGQLNIAVSWSSASDTLWVDLSASCTSDQYVAGTCQFIFSDRTAIAASQKTPSLNSIAPGTYVLIIDNRGPSDENVTYEVDLTS